MELVRRELGGDGGRASFYASSSSGARYPSDAGLNRYGIAAMGSSCHHDQVRQSSYQADSTYLGNDIGTAGTSLCDPFLVHSYREDRELEIRRRRLREIADRIELAHFHMLEEHDRRSLAIAERNPYARPIPFYPELPSDNSQVNYTAQAIPHSRSAQRVAPTYPELLDERHNVQKNIKLGPPLGPQGGAEVPSILRREKAVSSIGPSSLPELQDGARSHHLPVESVEMVHPVGPARDVFLDKVSGPHTNKKYKLALPPGKLKSTELHEGVVVATPENKQTAGSYSDKKIQPDLTQIPNEVVQTPENKESADSSINRKRKLHLPPINLKQKHGKPIKEALTSLPEKKVKPAADTTEPGWIGSDGGWFCGLCKINTLTKRDLDHHFQSNGHLDKLNALLNRSKKSEPVNKIVPEKPGQGVSQVVSLQKLEEPKEETSKSVHVPQSDKLKEVTFRDKGNPSSTNRTVIVTGHKIAKQPPPKFSKNKNKNEINVAGNSSTKPVLVEQDGKWFCNLCEAKCFSEKTKEDHIKGKRHKQNLQAQRRAVSQRPGPPKQLKPAANLHFCVICNISCTSKNALIEHFNGKKHRYLAMTNPISAV